jgi:hypothetical protein
VSGSYPLLPCVGIQAPCPPCHLPRTLPVLACIACRVDPRPKILAGPFSHGVHIIPTSLAQQSAPAPPPWRASCRRRLRPHLRKGTTPPLGQQRSKQTVTRTRRARRSAFHFTCLRVLCLVQTRSSRPACRRPSIPRPPLTACLAHCAGARVPPV